MKKYILISFLLIALCIACVDKKPTQQNESFTILGNVENIPDSSWVFLQNNSQLYDSTIVINGKFILEGKVDGPTSCFIIIKSTMDYKSFWIENNKMTFNAIGKYFLDAKITGSKTQLEADKQWELISPIRKRIDSLRLILRKEKDKNKIIIEELKELHAEMKDAEIKYIQENPNSLPSVHALSIYKKTWGIELTDSLYSKLSTKLQETKEGKSIQRYIDLNKNPRIGDHYIDFTQTDVDGNIIKFSDIKAKVVLLDFWSSTCGPCRYENKGLVKIYEEFNSKGFEIFAVSSDSDKERWLKAIKEDGLIWTNVRDEFGRDSDPFLIYGINSIPDNFLINNKGEIIGRNLRGEELKNKLLEII